MSKIDDLKRQLSECEANIRKYDGQIGDLKISLDDIANMLQDETATVEALEVIISNGEITTLDENGKFITIKKDYAYIIDYSVTKEDLVEVDEIEINGATVKIYSSKKTDALYVVSPFEQKNNTKKRNELITKLKEIIPEDKIAILTYGDNLYQYDINNSNNCTTNYDVVGKDQNGKMYAFKWQDRKNEDQYKSHIVANDSGNRDLIVSLKGMVLANCMDLYMEGATKNEEGQFVGTEVHINFKPRDKIIKNQVIEEFVRLAFPSSEEKGIFATMDGEWQNFANTKENKNAGTWISNWEGDYGEGVPNGKAVFVGNRPLPNLKEPYIYDYTKQFVGHVDTETVPVTITTAKPTETRYSNDEFQLNASVNYHFSGDRNTIEVFDENGKKIKNDTSKDFAAFYQFTVKDWKF